MQDGCGMERQSVERLAREKFYKSRALSSQCGLGNLRLWNEIR